MLFFVIGVMHTCGSFSDIELDFGGELFALMQKLFALNRLKTNNSYVKTPIDHLLYAKAYNMTKIIIKCHNATKQDGIRQKLWQMSEHRVIKANSTGNKNVSRGAACLCFGYFFTHNYP